MIRQRTSHKKVVQGSCLFYDRLALQCASNVFCHRRDSPTLNTKIENARICGNWFSNPALVLVLVVDGKSLHFPHITRVHLALTARRLNELLLSCFASFLSPQKFTLLLLVFQKR